MASFGNIVALFLCIFVSYSESSIYPKKFYYPPKHGFGKFGGHRMYPIGKGGYMPSPNVFGSKFSKGGFNQQYYPIYKKVPMVRKVPIYRKVPVYKKVVINKPVYVPVYKDIPVPKPKKFNSRSWLPRGGPTGGVQVSQGPSFDRGIDIGGPRVDIGLDIGGPNLDMNIGQDMGGFGVDVGLDMNVGGNLDVGLGFGDPGFGDLGLGLGLGEFRAPAVQQRPTETVVTSNIQITDADHVTTNSNTNTANSQSHSSSLALNSNIGVHDADAVHLNTNTDIGFGGATNNEMSQFGLDASAFGGAGAAALDLASLLGPQGLGPAAGGQGGGVGLGLGVGDGLGGALGGLGHDPFGAGSSHGGPMVGGFDQGFSGGQGSGAPTDSQLASILSGLGAGQDHVATAATHQGQQGMLTGEPFAIVSVDGQQSPGGVGVGHGPRDLGVHGGHSGMSLGSRGHGGMSLGSSGHGGVSHGSSGHGGHV